MATAALTAEERQQRLNDASEKFMRDEISAEAFEDAKRQYVPDYRSALLALAKSSPESEVPKDRDVALPALHELAIFILAVLALILIGLPRSLYNRDSRKEAA